MNDDEVLHRITHLVDEEHRLREHAVAGHPLSDDDERRLPRPRGQPGSVLGSAPPAAGPARRRPRPRRRRSAGPFGRRGLLAVGSPTGSPSHPRGATVPTCAHLDLIQPVTPSSEGCEDCLAAGRHDWVHLRVCQVCGHVGCCDSSPSRHATGHFKATGHPLVRSYEPGEEWYWCFPEQLHLRAGGCAPGPVAPLSAVRPRSAPRAWATTEAGRCRPGRARARRRAAGWPAALRGAATGVVVGSGSMPERRSGALALGLERGHLRVMLLGPVDARRCGASASR